MFTIDLFQTGFNGNAPSFIIIHYTTGATVNCSTSHLHLLKLLKGTPLLEDIKRAQRPIFPRFLQVLTILVRVCYNASRKLKVNSAEKYTLAFNRNSVAFQSRILV